MSMELSRQQVREQALSRFKYVKTCILARELCLLVRTNRVAFNLKDAQECCQFISNLCSEAGCEEQSQICAKAADAVTESEEKYLDLCQQSCMKCGESRRPAQKKTAAPNNYVA
jgi:hypothetical protein